MKILTNQNRLSVCYLLIAFLFTSCANESIDLKENPDQKEEVYEQILSNEELFRDFMDEMRGNDTAMQWMVDHRPMMRNFYGRKQVTHMMRNQPEVMDSVMQGMMMMYEKDSLMRRSNPQIRERMRQHMMLMMERDSVLSNQMREHMQQRMNKK